MGTANAALKQDGASALDLLAQSEFFRQCGADDLAALAAATRFEAFAAHSDIVREGESALDVFVIQHGEAVVLKEGVAAGLYEIARLHPGDSFGEMALLDPGTRSATVRSLTPVTALVIPIDNILELAKNRPTFVHALIGLARLVAGRLRTANSTAVESLDRALAEERTRTTMGKFIFALIMVYSLYTWMLGTVAQVKEALGRSELVTVPAILFILCILAWFVRTSGYPASFFGITLKNAGRHVAEAVLLTLPWMALAVVMKMWMVANVESMAGLPLFQMFAASGMENTAGGASAFNPWLTLAYIVFVPFQELIYRGALQGALDHFLTGPWRHWLAIIGSNVIFSAGHLYISPGLSITAFVAGLFWGWLYNRQRGLAGVSVSHILLGFWAFEVVDLGVLE